MASVDRNTLNPVEKSTDVHANTRGSALFAGTYTFAVDAHPVFAGTAPIGGQDLDAAYGRALNVGRGVVGEGGDRGPGVVGIAGGVIANPGAPFPRPLHDGPPLGRGMRAGVVGFGSDPAMHGERGQGDAVGVLGIAERSVGTAGLSNALPGVLGFARAHAGVYGSSGTTGVIGDGTQGQVGVEGISGGLFGVYGHVNYAAPSPDAVGVFGAAVMDLTKPGVYTGRAGVFIGPAEVHGKLYALDDLIVWGAKSAAAKHRDGSHRLMYCVESPDSRFEDFGEAALVDGRADVAIDADFAAIADLRGYQVFVTPYGDCNGLCITRRGRNGFQVREAARGRSSIAFGWRIVAKRRDVATERFARVERPTMPKLPKPLAPPPLDLASTSERERPSRKR